MEHHLARRIFVGLLLIVVGFAFLGSQLGYFTMDIGELASTYWPVFMIFFGLSGLFGQLKARQDGGASYIWHLFIIVLGAGFLAKNLGIFTLSMGEFIKLLIPMFIILFGIRMMFKSNKPTVQKQDYSYKYEYKYEHNPDKGDFKPETTELESKYYEPPASHTRHHWHPPP